MSPSLFRGGSSETSSYPRFKRKRAFEPDDHSAGTSTGPYTPRLQSALEKDTQKNCHEQHKSTKWTQKQGSSQFKSSGYRGRGRGGRKPYQNKRKNRDKSRGGSQGQETSDDDAAQAVNSTAPSPTRPGGMMVSAPTTGVNHAASPDSQFQQGLQAGLQAGLQHKYQHGFSPSYGPDYEPAAGGLETPFAGYAGSEMNNFAPHNAFPHTFNPNSEAPPQTTPRLGTEVDRLLNEQRGLRAIYQESKRSFLQLTASIVLTLAEKRREKRDIETKLEANAKSLEDLGYDEQEVESDMEEREIIERINEDEEAQRAMLSESNLPPDLVEHLRQKQSYKFTPVGGIGLPWKPSDFSHAENS